MNFRQLFESKLALAEANIAAKIQNDPKQAKMLAIAWRHDSTLPKSEISKLGPRPTDQDIVQAWSKLLDDTLRRNNYGDLSADGRFDQWLTKLYINGAADYEDINGEGGDALGAWLALSKRGKLKPADQDFNRFVNINQLQRIQRDPQYRDELRRIKDAEHIEKMKRDAKQIVLIDNDRYRVVMPLNYGSCYSLDKSEGFEPTFCTSSSSGLRWFNNYAPDGPIINITDKENKDDVNGKWQFHSATSQLVRGDQEQRHNLSYNDERFSKLFPGLMKEIVSALEAKAPEIQEASKELTRGGYDIGQEVARIKSKYPLSFASVPETDDGEMDHEDGPGTYTVTHIPSGKVANIPAESLENLHSKLTGKYPNIPLEDYQIQKQTI